ncbi:hypothetical protein MMC08_006641 [Hypocenomyce scalaris]|nr:hypothetical protein [Hypocenomyce scalaris]
MASSSLFVQVHQHLLNVTEKPGEDLDRGLLERFGAQVTVTGKYIPGERKQRQCRLPTGLDADALKDSLDHDDRDTIIYALSQLLPTLQQDPSPATALIEILVRSPSYTFSDVLAIKPPVDFVAGLSAPSPPINSVALTLLGKATKEPSDAAIVAGKPDVVAALVKLWLCTSDTAVAQQAAKVLRCLLEVDFAPRILGEAHDIQAMTEDTSWEPLGQGLMWRRVFDDRDIYGSIFAICSLSTAGQAGQPSKRDKTIAQARLLEFLIAFPPSVTDAYSKSHCPDIEAAYGVRNGGLLDFAAVHMVDYKDDVLMHMTLIDFFAGLLRKYNGDVLSRNSQYASMVQTPHSSPTLDFLVSRGLHSRSMSFYLEPSKHDSLDLTYLYSRSANYISIYCTQYPTHLLNTSPSVSDAILARLLLVLSRVLTGHWAHDKAPKHDLHVLASLPRAALLPQTVGSSPLFLIPTRYPNADALHTLAAVFHGPSEKDRLSGFAPPKTSPDQPDPDIFVKEREAARVLYFLYLKHQPYLWTQVVSAAETVALKDNALAAIDLMSAVIGANWRPLLQEPPEASTHSRYPLPTESELSLWCDSPNQQLPPSGVLAILASPAFEDVLPYLLRPAQTFSNLVGGRGDTESAAYRVAVAKHDALILLHKKLKGVAQDVNGLQNFVAAVGRRVAQGPMGGSSEVGGRIGTMEL